MRWILTRAKCERAKYRPTMYPRNISIRIDHSVRITVAGSFAYPWYGTLHRNALWKGARKSDVSKIAGRACLEYASSGRFRRLQEFETLTAELLPAFLRRGGCA